MSDDNISHPKHYTSHDAICTCGKLIECIDVVRNMNFNLGNAVKYIWRHEHKGRLEDIKKAIWYLEDYVKEGERNFD